MLELTTRFLEAFKQIETHLRQRFDPGDGHLEFGRLLVKARGDRALGQYTSRLSRFAELRNVISHEPADNGIPIATPLISTVQRIEQIRDALLTPPKVGKFVQTQVVVSTTREDPIGPLLTRLLHGDFSQAPVIEQEGGTIGLVTTNAFARWAADQLDQFGMVDATDATVEAVMTKLERHERAVLMGRTANLAQAFSVLRAAAVGETVGPVAVIVTHSGKPTESILGVIVQADLMSMAEFLGLH
jgi:predicted transcriptional regulator